MLITISVSLILTRYAFKYYLIKHK